MAMFEAITTKEVLYDDELKASARGTKDAQFLFNKDIHDYCEMLLAKAVEFKQLTGFLI